MLEKGTKVRILNHYIPSFIGLIGEVTDPLDGITLHNTKSKTIREPLFAVIFKDRPKRYDDDEFLVINIYDQANVEIV